MKRMYVYVKSEPALWTVGFYDPSGKWQSESDHGTPEEAGQRVSILNGCVPYLTSPATAALPVSGKEVEEVVNEYREFVLRTGLSDRKSMQDWINKLPIKEPVSNVDAVEFGEWIGNNDYSIAPSGWYSGEEKLCKTTTELYTLFQKSKTK